MNDETQSAPPNAALLEAFQHVATPDSQIPLPWVIVDSNDGLIKVGDGIMIEPGALPRIGTIKILRPAASTNVQATIPVRLNAQGARPQLEGSYPSGNPQKTYVFWLETYGTADPNQKYTLQFSASATAGRLMGDDEGSSDPGYRRVR